MICQEEVVSQLEKRGFEWRYHSEEFNFTVLSKRVSSFGTLQVEVDEDGLCNGLPLAEFLGI